MSGREHDRGVSRSVPVLVDAVAIGRLDTDSDGDWIERESTFGVSG